MSPTSSGCELAEPLALVTGASGFVGIHLVQSLLQSGWRVRCTTRLPWFEAPQGVERCLTIEVGPEADWSAALDGVCVIFHLANRAHVFGARGRAATAVLQRVNAAGTARLARAACRNGARRIVYVSSIGVHGNSSGEEALTELSPIAPHNAYASSKAQAESALASECGSDVEWVVVRPPLIYGAGAPGNLQRLMRLVASGIPLPFGSVRNARSLAAVEHVVDLLLLCGRAAAASRQCYVVADAEDVSTPELIRTLAAGMARTVWLVPFPVGTLRAAAKAIGISETVEQLCGSLRVNAAKARRELGWTPRLRTRDALMSAARWYAATRAWQIRASHG